MMIYVVVFCLYLKQNICTFEIYIALICLAYICALHLHYCLKIHPNKTTYLRNKANVIHVMQ